MFSITGNAGGRSMNTCIQFMTALFSLLLPLPAAAETSELFVPLGATDKSARIVTVSPEGGDFTDPLAALASINDASADNPYLVLIGPGVYTVTDTLAMKPFVDIAGAGREATKLTGAISCLLYTSPSPRDRTRSRMPSSA